MKRFRFKMNEKVFPTVLICLKQLILRGFRIIEGYLGLYVGFPIDPFFKGEDLRCIAQPITRKLRENIENCILEKYQEISSQED